jgi:hypothetical protein
MNKATQTPQEQEQEQEMLWDANANLLKKIIDKFDKSKDNHLEDDDIFIPLPIMICLIIMMVAGPLLKSLLLPIPLPSLSPITHSPLVILIGFCIVTALIQGSITPSMGMLLVMMILLHQSHSSLS